MTRSHSWILTWTVLRLVMAAVIVAAVVTQLVATIGTTIELQRDLGTTLVNFFSFFTILSNVLAAIVLAWAALWRLSRGRTASVEPTGLAIAVASVSTYMIITGIVYNALLRGITLPQGSEPVPWSNEVLHLVGPLFLLADVFVGPLRRALPWRAVWAIIVFPIVWVVYTMIRGPLVTNPGNGDPSWYPYPFLNPANFANGYGGVIVYIIGIAIAIIGVGLLVVWIGRRRGAVTEQSAVGEKARTA